MIDAFKKAFGPEAKNYTKYREPYPKALFDLLGSALAQKSGKVLDIACGTGKSTEPLVETGLKVTGCDHDPLMIEEAKNQAKIKSLDIEYVVSEAENLPFADASFEAVTVGTAFHFFVNERAINEIKRVLKPNGLLLVYWTLTTKEIPEEDDIPASIFRKFKWVRIPSGLRDQDAISGFLKKAGFKGVSQKNIPIVFNTTVEERVGLQTTSGFYELLSESDKKEFLNDVRTALTKNLGSRSHFTLEEEIQACYGYRQEGI